MFGGSSGSKTPMVVSGTQERTRHCSFRARLESSSTADTGYMWWTNPTVSAHTISKKLATCTRHVSPTTSLRESTSTQHWAVPLSTIPDPTCISYAIQAMYTAFKTMTDVPSCAKNASFGLPLSAPCAGPVSTLASRATPTRRRGRP